MTEIWYRYEETRYSPGCDETDNPLPGTIVKVHALEFGVIKKTPKGAWIARNWGAGNLSGEKRFVLLAATKRYACPTEEEALTSFLARKRKQIAIYARRIRVAEAAIDIASRHDLNRATYVR